MKRRSDQITPRNGHSLEVLVIARISGSARQKELSLEDQEDHCRAVAAEKYTGKINYKAIATKGKGESLERKELKEIEKLLRTRKYDLMIAEDIGRIMRSAQAVRLCGIAVDHGVRVIAPNDCIDTADETWEEDVISACRDHVGHNAHTSKRLKHKLMTRLMRDGGAAAREIVGYIVGAAVTNYNDWKKDATATPVFNEWFLRLKKYPNCSALADWLNEQGFPTGPYADNEKWDGRMVRRVTANTVLKGMPQRGKKHTVKHHETGRRISVTNPAGPNYYECPHLIHVPAELWDEVNELLETSNAGLGRKPVEGRDGRAGVPKSTTVWPAQHVICGVCGRLMYRGGNGQRDQMSCSGARDYKCWNSASFDGVAAGPKLIRSFLEVVETLPDFDARFLAEFRKSADGVKSSRSERLLAIEARLAAKTGELKNVGAAIAKMGLKPLLEEQYDEAEAAQKGLLRERAAILGEADDVPQLPEMAELKRLAREATALGFDEPEFCLAMHDLIPRITALPYRLRDGGKIVFRAVMEIDLAPLAGEGECHLDRQLVRTATVDLFDRPQRAAHMDAIAAMRESGKTERQAAGKLGLTVTAAQRASALYRMTRAAGTLDPYAFVSEQPGDDAKLKKHLHQRYAFRALEGYPVRPGPA